MNDEFLEEVIRRAAPRGMPESLRVRLSQQMTAKVGVKDRTTFGRRLFIWSAMATTAASVAVVFLWLSLSSSDLPLQIAVQVKTYQRPVLLQTRTLGHSESAGTVMVGSSPYQVTRNSEINIREYADETFGKIEAYSYSNVSYRAEPLVIR